MKKLKHIFLAFTPILLALSIQYLIVIFAMGISALGKGGWCLLTDTFDLLTILDELTYLWTTNTFNTAVMIVYAAMTIVVFGLWYRVRYEGCFLPDARSTFHPLTFLGIFMLTPGMQYLSTYIVSFTAALFPSWLKSYTELLENAGLNDTLTAGLFLYSVIFAPFSEELIFRGVTLRQARRALPFWAANLLQAFLFGAYHMNMMQGIYAFCLGLILGYICERGGSIYHSLLLHLLFNLWAAALSSHLSIGNSVFAVMFWFVFGAVMTIGGIILFTIGTRKCQKLHK